jgi:hypothetical protein
MQITTFGFIVCAVFMAAPIFAADQAALDKAEADYKASVAECRKMQGDAQQACMKDAQAARDRAISAIKK